MKSNNLILIILVSSFGYFVDVYDLVLFLIVRLPSLHALGYVGDNATHVGLQLVNWQMTGMLLGGVIWGVIGDKYGRMTSLYGSIILFSLATLANAWVTNIYWYAFLRFIAGFGLAGELGAGITLVSELLPKNKRSYGAMAIAGFGVLGGALGGVVGTLVSWKTAYIIGGSLGLLLLLIRLTVKESKLFEKMKLDAVSRGNLLILLKSKELIFRYLKCLFIGAPIWVVIGLFVNLSPELGVVFGIEKPIIASNAIICYYIGLGMGDVTSGFLSQLICSRRYATIPFLVLMVVVGYVYLTAYHIAREIFYLLCGLLGFSSGFWALMVLITAEQFGTNLRGTVAVSAPNFIRASIIPASITLELLKPYFGLSVSLGIVGCIAILFSAFGVWGSEETFAKDLDYYN